MQTIIRRTVTALGTIVVAATAACSSGSPTDATVVPSDARFDGGITFGSGNFVGTTPTQSTAAADSGSAASGGITFGSGN
ncbi:MAG TPA: hypothetical protein VFS20_12660 [Longimicrobium sp.]|nr:hypothetical protein [Longimicrobium sp.]